MAARDGQMSVHMQTKLLNSDDFRRSAQSALAKWSENCNIIATAATRAKQRHRPISTFTFVLI